jgi:uncharacterized protein YdeI (YjbR/CyaY-like superfamily)
MKPIFFTTPSTFRDWLSSNHESKTELVVGFYKVKSKLTSITWSQSVDEALCFGWIDGIRKSIDEQSYQIRFTPRKKGSIWSAVNIKKIEKLKKQGLLKSKGITSFENRTESKSKIYAFEQKEVTLRIEFEIIFKKNKKAWHYFLSLVPFTKKALYIG